MTAIFFMLLLSAGMFGVLMGTRTLPTAIWVAKTEDDSARRRFGKVIHLTVLKLAGGMIATIAASIYLCVKGHGAMVPCAFLLLAIVVIIELIARNPKKTCWLFIGARALVVIVSLGVFLAHRGTAWNALADAAPTTSAKAAAKAALNENDIVIDFDEAEDGTITQKVKNSDFPAITMSEEEQRKKFGAEYEIDVSKETWPSRREARIRAITKAKGPTIVDPVAMPFDNIEDLKKFSKLPTNEQKKALEEAWGEVEKLIFSCSIYGHMWLQFLDYFEYITINNSWIPKDLKKLDDDLLEGHGGWDKHCVTGRKISENAAKIVTTKYYHNLATKIVLTLREFDKVTVEKRQTKVNWCNPERKDKESYMAQASYARTQKADYQERWDAIILRLKDSSGKERILGGVGIWDKRAEIYGDHLAIVLPTKTITTTPPSIIPRTPTGTPKNPDPNPTKTPKVTDTPVPTPKITNTPIPTPDITNTPIPTPDVTNTPIPTPTPGVTNTPTPTPTEGPTLTPVPTDPPTPDPTKQPEVDPGNTNKVPDGGGAPNDQPNIEQPSVTTSPPYVAPTAPPATEVPVPPPVINDGANDIPDVPSYVPGGSDITITDSFVDDSGTTNIVDSAPTAPGGDGAFVGDSR